MGNSAGQTPIMVSHPRDIRKDLHYRIGIAGVEVAAYTRRLGSLCFHFVATCVPIEPPPLAGLGDLVGRCVAPLSRLGCGCIFHESTPAVFLGPFRRCWRF